MTHVAFLEFLKMAVVRVATCNEPLPDQAAACKQVIAGRLEGGRRLATSFVLESKERYALGLPAGRSDSLETICGARLKPVSASRLSWSYAHPAFASSE